MLRLIRQMTGKEGWLPGYLYPPQGTLFNLRVAPVLFRFHQQQGVGGEWRFFSAFVAVRRLSVGGP